MLGNRHIKSIRRGIFFVAYLILSSITLTVGFTTTTHATGTGETYTWVDANNIKVSGGGIADDTAISMTGDTGSLSIVLDVSANGRTGQCKVYGGVTFSAPSTLTFTRFTGASAGALGDIGTCGNGSDITEKSTGQALNDVYPLPSATLTISNSRPGSGGPAVETPSQRTVAAEVCNWKSESPDKITITLKKGSKTKTATVKFNTLAADTFGDKDKYGDPAVYCKDYKTVFDDVDPGTWQLCSSINSKCVSVKKEIYKTNSAYLEIGTQPELAGDRKINGEVIVDVSHGMPDGAEWGSGSSLGQSTVDLTQDVDFGTYEVTLSDKDGKALGTKEVHVMYDGSICKDQMDSGSEFPCVSPPAVTGSFSFGDIDPGKYKVCIKGTTKCVSVTKEADLAVDDADIKLTADEAVKYDTSGVLGSKAGDEATQCNIPKTGWILCPVLDTMANIGDQAFSFLSNNFLSIDTKLFDTSSGTYTAWTKFRDIANVAFVIAVMIVVYSQLTGAGISNYGIKKLLPRIVVAAILVNLSYFICQLAVDISNILGYTFKNWFDSLAGSIKLPGGDISDATSDTNGSPLGWVGIVTAVVVAGTLVWLFLGALVPIMLAALIAMFMILFILLARKALIVLLIALAPLAFVAYLLPNTEQWFKRWQKTFFQLLMVFPIIAVIFGASGLASKIIQASDNGTMMRIIAAGVAVIPLFVVPGLLKKSIDAAGNIGAKLNGIGNKAGGWAGKKGSERFERSAIGRGRTLRRQAKSQYRDRRFAERLNKGGVTGVLAGGAAGVLPRGLQTKGARYQQEALSRSAAGTAREAESKDVNYESAQLNTEATKQAAYVSPTTGKAGGSAYLQDQFNQAIQEGNTVKAKAALQSLKAQGDSGVEAIQETLAQHSSAGGKLDNTEMSHDLRSYVAESHSDLKGKDSRITNWAGEGGEEAIKKADFSGLTDAQVASQTKASLAAAQSSTTSVAKAGAMLDSTRSARVKAAADAGTIELKESKRNAMP